MVLVESRFAKPIRRQLEISDGCAPRCSLGCARRARRDKFDGIIKLFSLNLFAAAAALKPDANHICLANGADQQRIIGRDQCALVAGLERLAS